jgi:hypothetical protein
MHKGLEPELQKGLRPVTAPPELWDRLKAAQVAPPRRTNQKVVWAMAAAVVLIAVGLSSVYRESVAGDEASALQALATDSQRIAFHCQNPAQLRAWVRAKTGLDLPLRAESSPSIQLIGAQTIGGTRGVEVAYRTGNRDAVLVVSRAEAGSADLPHRRVSGNVSSWVMDGQRYTLACNDPADLQLACKLCHLD